MVLQSLVAEARWDSNARSTDQLPGGKPDLTVIFLFCSVPLHNGGAGLRFGENDQVGNHHMIRC